MRISLQVTAIASLWAVPACAQLPSQVVTATAVTTVSAERPDVTGLTGGAVTPAGKFPNIYDIDFSVGMIWAVDSHVARVSGSARLSCTATSVGSGVPQ